MIEQIATLLKNANAQSMNLTIRINDNNQVSIIANTILNPTLPNESTTALELRGKLTLPLIIQGDINELDVSFCEKLTTFTDSFVPAAQTHNALLNTTALIDNANKKVTTKAPKTTPENKNIVSSNPTSETTPLTNKPETISATSFENNEADSL